MASASSGSGNSSHDGQRDEILASFQDFTQVEDVDACIRFLENCRWNLQEAIETALAIGPDWATSGNTTSTATADDFGITTSTATATANEISTEEPEFVSASDLTLDSDRERTENPFRALLNRGTEGQGVYSRQPPLELDDYAAMPQRRMLNFTVNFDGKSHSFSLRDDESIGDLKTYIARDFGSSDAPMETKDMDLGAWRGAGERDETRLFSLHLPKENVLKLSMFKHPGGATASASNGSVEKGHSSDRQYRLDVYDKESDRTYQLTVDSSRTVGDVKRDVYALTNVPPSRQSWTGWPRAKNGKLEDFMRLADLALDTPVHRMRVERSATTATAAAASNEANAEVSDDEEEDESVDVMADGMDDSMVIDDNHLSPAPAIERHDQVPLIPADYASPYEAIENLLRVYEARYGENHPYFYHGPMEDAIRDSCQVKATQRKPLLIYLHDDASVSANVFSTQVFSTSAIADFLNQNFVVWAWDCTLQENKNKLLLLLSTQLGSTLAYELKQLERDRYPVLIFVHKARGALEVVHVHKAPVALDELMSELMQVVDAFRHQNRLDVIDEEERDAREKMRSEQMKAYQDSLQADRMKAEQKRLEEERVLAEQKNKEEEAAKFEAELKKLTEQLPPEPTDPSRSTTIRLRLPTAEMIERRFLVSEKLSTLLKFAASKGYKWDKYRLLTSYPKRDLTELDNTKTLQELKLCPRETVVVEEK